MRRLLKKMKTYKELEEEFDKKVAELQKECKHEKTTIMDHMWRIGAYSDYRVEICDICNKEIRKIYANGTDKPDPKYVKVKCQNPNCNTMVEVLVGQPYFGILCKKCSKPGIYKVKT